MIKSSKYLLLVFVLTFNALFSFANPTNEKLRHFVLSAGVFKANSEEVSYSYSSSGVESGTPVPVIVPGFTVGYELNKTFEFSGYIAYSNMGHRLLLVENSDGMYVLIDSEGVVRLASNDKNFTLGSNTVFYGVSLKCNFLPIITGQENLRFSLYAISNFGLISAKWKELEGINWMKKWNGPFTEFGLGLGVGYSFTKRMGINFSYSLGKFYNEDKSRLYIGMGFKL